MTGGRPREPDPAVLDLAQALMAEITGRLEDLAALAVDHQRAVRPAPDLGSGLRAVLCLAEAHQALLTPAPESERSLAPRRSKRAVGRPRTKRASG